MRAPFYFGAPARPLFGWYQTPEAGSRRDEAVGICQPLGHEYLNAHRSMRHLADRLAAAGLPVVRFDYDGIADSCGRDDDPDRLAAWLTSIRQAVDMVRREV